jgi:hypothetical protein
VAELPHGETLLEQRRPYLLIGEIKIAARHERIPKWRREQHTFLEAKSIDDFRPALVAAD